MGRWQDGILYDNDTVVKAKPRLASADIKKGTAFISPEAFAGCRNLRSVRLPDTLRRIGYRAFAWCERLESLVLPAGLNEIGAEAFLDCTNLTAAIVPDTLRIMGCNAFRNCPLRNVSWKENGVIYWRNTVIGADTDLAEAVIRKGTVEIGADAFADCYKLRSAAFPDSLLRIGDRAFTGEWSGCFSNLLNGDDEEDSEAEGEPMSLTFPPHLVSIGAEAFEYCTKLKSVTFPESLTDIGDKAFAGCHMLQSLALPDGLRRIGFQAFAGCNKLSFVKLPERLGELGSNAFRDCPLDYVPWKENGLTYWRDKLVGADTNITCAVIRAGTKSIAVQAFMDAGGDCFSSGEWGREQLTSVSLPDSVTVIEPQAFWGCSGLTDIDFPGNLERIGSRAFECCGSLLSVTIPASVRAIGDSAFASCGRLKSVRFPDDLDSIGCKAFSHCGQLVAVQLPKQLRSIGHRAFEYCTRLTVAQLPDGLESTGKKIFHGCSTAKKL